MARRVVLLGMRERVTTGIASLLAIFIVAIAVSPLVHLPLTGLNRTLAATCALALAPATLVAEAPPATLHWPLFGEGVTSVRSGADRVRITCAFLC